MERAFAIRRLARRVTILLLLLAGCEGDWWGTKKILSPEPPPQPRSPATTDPLTAGMIGEKTLLSDASPEPLRGFGLVVGLNGKGSSDCPTSVREYIIEFLSKQIGPQGATERRPRLTPEQLIDSTDTAVVEVSGHVLAGALSGSRFDLRVEAIQGTSTESLSGGLLLPTQLRFFDPAAGGQGLFAGNVLAEGGGPVFVSPFTHEGDTVSDADARRGVVLGGGRVIEPRPARFTLLQPNYSVARAIERRINERFGHKPPTAKAQSKGYVTLETPHAYALRPQAFHHLAAHLYLENDAAAIDRKLHDLSSLATSGDADIDRVALAWEGMGNGVLPHLQPFYADANPTLRFYAGRAGFRLNDPLALAPIADAAASGPHSLRLLAIRELGETNSPQAPLKLAPLLDDPDQEVRIAAYEALLQHGHPAIQSTRFAHILDRSQLNFSLDVVESDGPPLIYVRRTRLPRIAVFGRQIALIPPVFYTQADDSLTIHTVDGSDDVMLFMKRRGRLSEQVVVPPRAVDLITALAQLPIKDETGRLSGLGLPYSRVVQVLADMCRGETISAALVFEQTTLTDLFGPEISPERPESEQDTGTTPGTEASPDDGKKPEGERPEAPKP